MNRLSRFHDALAIISIGAPLTGLFVGAGPTLLSQYVLCVFMLLMRVKFWIDDIEYFESADRARGRRDARFQIGFGLGVLSWVLFTIAGLSVLNTNLAGLFLLLGMGLSTGWVLVELVSDKSYKDQAWFLGFNILYMIAFALLWQNGDGQLMWLGLALAIATLAVDLAMSSAVEKILGRD